MYNNLKQVFVLFALTFILVSCEKNLDLIPEDDRNTSASAFEDPASYRAFLAKIYAGISLSGQEGPAGNPDLEGLDEGFSNYLRLYWMMQELTTDEALIGWDDGTIKDLHSQNWTAGNEFIRTVYSRIMYQIALSNEFLRQTSAEKLDERGVNGQLRDEIQNYRAEVRFMRALSYWHAMDLFANPPFVTEDDPIGAFLPEQTNRDALFTYVESELLDIENSILTASQSEYGRANQAAVWSLLAKLYLNADVYIGTARYDSALTYCNKVISGGYSIATTPYTHLFLADNNTNGAQTETIFAIPFDGINTLSFGGMTFLVHAPVGGSMDPSQFGINGGWAGIRTTSTFVEQFPGEENSPDGRSQFYTDGQSKEIASVPPFNQGYAVQKFRNLDVNGDPGSDPNNHPDTDFPMFRLSDIYLMYAECVLRNGGGDMSTAVNYINELRQRAYGDTSGNISQSDLTLDFILSERSRELYWEAHRRTDLIRFGKFSAQGVWPWKGNVPNGSTTEAFRDIMPIPASDLGVNPNLVQNPGY
ncbi:RagB/SusD family nutrient uptake outer membrane protein [Ulvibacter antarcticus]|uniref:Putative outer membrane starch-binding protein n=1 Tax=Ulvibacter antarcticus TaxID=442714 RepID=A0A3L9YH86_9FLAO|nr:RagB/SusD family nutrient uptake outer membrane protein [Ulvibacter antarcticus]RMA58830.1 putative outer membrane starch-binding protein [Ulvibacter antarcticus]